MHSQTLERKTEHIELVRSFQQISSFYGNALILKKGNTAFFSDSTSKGKNIKEIKKQIQSLKIHCKAFPVVKSNRLSHYVAPTG